ncbi:MAG: PQQ-binding-like beta-propeller repeat protein [Fuerstiella sp.]|jgi:outer membrane protein assembly factor BamB|nr:PQQ-binding-like beta-propeller repeat protein [Fuerstiella sp.]
MTLHVCRSISAAIILGGLFVTAQARDWPRFRGPNGAGISDATTVPTEWTVADYNWQLNLQGRGHSSPVIQDGRLFVTSCDEESATRRLHCVNTDDGSPIWTREFEFVSHKKHKNNSFASSTPCVDKDHVYVVWHSRQSSPLLAFDHQGNRIWEYDLGPYLHGQGGATSPIVYDDLVILANDQKDPSFLLAVDRMTGQERWKIPREGKRACYGTPCVLDSGTRPAEVVFTHCFEGITGVDPRTGQQTWHIDVFGRAPQRALGSPVLADDLVIATSGGIGGDRQLVAVRPSGSGVSVETTEAYRTKRQTPHVPTPIVYKDWLFMWSDQGIASCLDKSTGEVIWQERVGGNYFSSPICIDGKLYCADLDGKVVVIAAADKYTLLARNDLGEPTKATPAVSSGTLFLRTESQLYSLGGRRQQ